MKDSKVPNLAAVSKYYMLTATLCVYCCVLLVLYYDRTTSKQQVLHDSDFESTWWMI